VSDDREQRPNWTDEGIGRKARDFVDPPDEDPPDDNVPIEPPDANDESE
jgi:hypothetical protein